MIKLNIGGVVHHSTTATLGGTDCLLGTIARRGVEGEQGGSGGVAEAFVDRDGVQFWMVLEYLRHHTIAWRYSNRREAGRREGYYYGVDDLSFRLPKYYNDTSEWQWKPLDALKWRLSNNQLKLVSSAGC